MDTLTEEAKEKLFAMLPLLNAGHVKVANWPRLLKLISELKSSGLEKLQVISDYDATITRHHINGERIPSSFGILTLCKSIPETFTTANRTLAAKYYPIEQDPKLTREEKFPHMVKWYSECQDMFDGLEFVQSDLVEAVKAAVLREGTVELFRFLSAHRVPTLLLSAGLGNIIKTTLSSHGIEEDENMHIVSNFFKTEGSTIRGFGCYENGEFLHPFNKNGLGCSGYFKKLGDSRRNVLLMGDTIGDSNMHDGVPLVENVLKIGFLYGTQDHIDGCLPQYMDNFDIVLIDDQTMHIPNALLNLVLEKSPIYLRKDLHTFVEIEQMLFLRLDGIGRFDEKESISGVQQLKSSVQKGIRGKIVEQFPHLEAYIDNVMPKKDTFRIVKCHEHIELLINTAGELLFFRHREGPWMPTLKLLHKYPFFLPQEQVDKGAIRFVLSGANIMCPGLTSPGAKLTPVDKGSVVAVMAEGKQHALAIGLTSMSTDDILKVNKGIGIENCHYLNDGLWQMKPIK